MAGLGAGFAAMAQPVDLVMRPAEAPPAGYMSEQYVDSRGCAFLRSHNGVQQIWVMRRSRSGTPLCGYAPSITSAAARPSDGSDASARAAATLDRPGEGPGRRQGRPGQGEPELGRQGDAYPRDWLLVANKFQIRGEALWGGKRFSRVIAAQNRQVSSAEGVVTAARDADATKSVRDHAVDGQKLTRKAKTRRKAAVKSQSADGQMQISYVQIGMFGVDSNADAALARITALGLPACEGRLQRGGRSLRVIYAGPFAKRDGALSALRDLRAGGFSDAFIR
jgi:cell division septation protein DedD